MTNDNKWLKISKTRTTTTRRGANKHSTLPQHKALAQILVPARTRKMLYLRRVSTWRQVVMVTGMSWQAKVLFYKYTSPTPAQV